MSEKALEADPNNWKALVNKAHIQSFLAHVELPMQKDDETAKEFTLNIHHAALEECFKAMTLPGAEKKSIQNI